MLVSNSEVIYRLKEMRQLMKYSVSLGRILNENVYKNSLLLLCVLVMCISVYTHLYNVDYIHVNKPLANNTEMHVLVL